MKLPAELQAAIKAWPKTKESRAGWLDASKLPPVPFEGEPLDSECVLGIAHHDAEARAALKRHAPPEALDHFVAQFCRQVPDDEAVHYGYNMWRWIAGEWGGRETAAVLTGILAAKLILHKTKYSSEGSNGLVFGAAGALGQIGDLYCLPALTLCRFRLHRLKHRFLHGWVHEQMVAIARRLAISPADAEDWCVPDAAGPDEIEEFSRDQAARLEKAMSTERRWTVASFDRRIVHQAILGPLAAGLVWGYFDPDGRLLLPFLIHPDLSYPAAPAGAAVGIVHPAHLTPDEAAKWRQRTADLPAPFDQWKPAVHALSAEELAGDRILRLPTVSLPAATLLCRLEAMGWTRPKGKTLLKFHGRLFPEFGIGAIIEYSGIPLTYGTEWGEQKIESCFFAAHCERIPLSKVSPIAISAVLADLEALGKPREVKKK